MIERVEIERKIREELIKRPLDLDKLLFEEMNDLHGALIENREIYEIVENLESLLLPTRVIENVYRKIYEYLFLPYLEEDRSISFAPFSLVHLPESEEYYIHSEIGPYAIIKKGNAPVSKNFYNFISLLYYFAELQSKNHIPIKDEDISKKYRLGKVKLKFVEEPEITEEEAKELKKKYYRNLKRKLPSDEITLREYLSVVDIIYEALGLNDEKDVIEKRRKYGDFRMCGLLDLPLDDPARFMEWRKKYEYSGCHSFEIIKGVQTGGIQLFPPSEGKYTLHICIPSKDFLKIIDALIEKKIPFKGNVIEILNFLSGDVDVNVNKLSYFPGGISLYISYENVREKDKIKWKKLREVEYKKL
jgi:hypothetical protein